MNRFDPLEDPIGDLASRTLLISASAGTGKTWTVAHLATRWLLESEENDPSRLLLVTYSKAAAAELRSRLRRRVAEVGRVLDDPGQATDRWTASLAELSTTERHRLADRQADVLSMLDDVNARTIHSFASMVGRSTTARTTAGGSLYERAVNETLTRASLTDLALLRTLVEDPTDPTSSTGTLSLAKVRERLAGMLRGSASIGGIEPRVGGSSKAHLVQPPIDDPEALAKAQVMTSLLLDAERRVRELMAMEHDVTFDEMITGVYWEVQEGGNQAIESLRTSFGFVLIDEFQDTDAAQWSIFESVFRGHVPVVIVGDPKQAIYGFRGGDVVIFQRLLGDDRGDTLSWELDRNFRSGERLLGQLNALFSIAESEEARALFSGPDALAELPRTWAFSSPTRRDGDLVRPISFRPVTVGGDDQRTPEGQGSLQIRDLTVVRPLATLHDGGQPDPPWDTAAPKGIDRGQLEDDLLDDLVQVVRSYRDGGTDLEDICVLVRMNRFATEARDHLRRHGIPAVTTKTEPVFTSPAADQLRCLLWALTEPTNPRLGGLLEFTWFSYHDLESMVSLATTLETFGPGALCRRVLDTATMHVILRSEQPERNWTDMDHLFSLLGERFAGGVLATSALGWLDEMMAGSEEAGEDEAAVRRVESHGGSVTVMTVHSSKGLEFPVVLCPQIEMPPSSNEVTKQRGVLSTSAGREFDLERLVADKVADANEGGIDEALQTSDEGARLIYVAMTRAKRDLVVWLTDLDRHQWGKSTNAPSRILQTSLLRLLVESSLLLPPAVRQAIGTGLGEVPFDLTLEIVRPATGEARASLTPVEAPPKAIDLNGVLDPPRVDESLRRWSYSALHLHATGSGEPLDVGDEARQVDYDGGARAEDVVEDVQVGARLGSNLFAGYAGAEVGNAIHEVFENVVGLPSGQGVARLGDAIAAAFAGQGLGVDEGQLADLVDQFTRLLDHPLGPVLGGSSLAHLADGGVARTANEMRFTLPLEGAGEPADRLIELGRIVADAEPDGPYGAFFRSLADATPVPRQLFRGFLVGSIDLVAQIDDPLRFVVVDYKSNLLKEAQSFSPRDLEGEMALSGYPLQALLYSVALHRFLQRRLAGYVPAQHLGGICYFYVRGALLEDQGSDAGLVTWRPPSEAVIEVSSLLAGRRDS